MADVVFNFVGNTRQLSRSIDSVNRKFRFMKQGLTAVGVAIGAATAVGVGASLQAFSNFDSAITQSQAIMKGLTDSQSQRMKQLAIDMSKAYTFSAAEIAKAFYFLTSAGFNVEQSLGSLPVVVQFAQAGMFDLASATDLLTDAQSALGLTVDDVAKNTTNMIHVSDVLVEANRLANASVEQFSQALTTKAAAAAKIAELSFESLVSALAVFADQGTKGEEAGTRMNIVLREMQTKSRTTKEGWDKYNLTVWDTYGKMRKLHEIIGDMDVAFAKMTAQQKKAALAELGFQDRSVIAVQMLLGNTERMKGYFDALLQASGATQTVSDRQLESFQARMTILKNRLTAVGIIIGEVLSPALETAARKFVEFIEWAAPYTSTVQEWASKIISNVEAIFRDIAERGWIQKAAEQVAEFFKNAGGYLGVGEASDTKEDLKNFGAKIGEFLAGPTGAKIGEGIGNFLGNLVGSTIDYFKNNPLIQQGPLDWGESLGQDISNVATTLYRVADAVAEAVTKTEGWALVLEFAKGFWEDIASIGGVAKEKFQDLLDVFKSLDLDSDRVVKALKNIGIIVGGVVLVAFKLLGNLLKNIAGPIFDLLIGGVELFVNSTMIGINLIIGVINILGALLKGDFKGAWIEVKNTVFAIWENIKGMFSGVTTIVVGVGELLVGVFRALSDTVYEILDTLFNVSKEQVFFFFATTLANAALNAISTAGSILKDVGHGIWVPIREGLNFVWNIDKQIWKGITGLVGLLARAFSNLYDFGSGIVDGILAGIEENFHKIWDSLTRMIRLAIEKMAKAAHDALTSIPDIIAGGVGSLVPNIVKDLIPGFAQGGYVNKPTLAVVGEREPEYIIPESKMGSMGGGVNIEKIIMNNYASPRDIAEELRFILIGYGA